MTECGYKIVVANFVMAKPLNFKMRYVMSEKFNFSVWYSSKALRNEYNWNYYPYHFFFICGFIMNFLPNSYFILQIYHDQSFEIRHVMFLYYILVRYSWNTLKIQSYYQSGPNRTFLLFILFGLSNKNSLLFSSIYHYFLRALCSPMFGDFLWNQERVCTFGFRWY